MQRFRMKICGMLLVSLSIAPFSSNAEIIKEAVLCEKTGSLCFYWWPKLPDVPGWRQDKGNSYHYSINAQTPTDSTFSDAETVIYAKAAYKAKEPELKDLNGFIQNDLAAFRGDDPGIKISEIAPMQTLSGQQLKRFSFAPSGKGNWEQVSYGEEKDKNGDEYFLTFVISSRTKAGLARNLSAYEQFISNYR